MAAILMMPAHISAETIGPKIEGQKYGLTDLTPKTLSVTAVQADNGLWGFVDQSGKDKIKPKYQAIGTPQQYEINAIGLSHNIKQGIIPVMLNGKWGFVNHNGKEVVKPVYDWVGQFKTDRKRSGFNEGDLEGTCMVVQGRRAFTINNKGKEIEGPSYYGVESVDGLLIVNQNNKLTLLDSNGKWTDLSIVDGGYILLNTDKGTSGFYNKNDKKTYTIAIEPNWIKDDSGLVYSIDNTGNIDRSTGGFNKVEKSGKFIIATKNDKQGLLTEKGKEIIAPTYDGIEVADDKNILIKKDGKFGVASADGNILIEPSYPSLSVKNGYIVFTTSDNNKGLLTASGKEILAPQYEDIDVWPDNIVIYKKNGKYGAATTTGEILFEPLYSNISQTNDQYLTLATGNEKNSLYDIKNKKIVLSDYEKIGEALNTYNRTFYTLKKNGKWGIINDKFQIVIPCEYSGIWGRSQDREYAYIKNASGTGLVKFNDDNIAKVVVRPGIFDSFFTAYETNFIVGEKNNSKGAYCKKNGAVIKPGQGADYFTYSGGIIFAPKAQSGTMNAFNSKGEFVGTFTGSATQTQRMNNWLNQIVPKLK